MKVFLLHRDRDFDLEQPLPANEEALRQDLELDTLFAAMAGGDGFLFEVAKAAVISSLTDPDAIVYRQDVLRDCLEHPETARELYEIAIEAILAEKKVSFGWLRDSPNTILHRSVSILQLLLETLKRLRQLADERAGDFESEGFRRFFAMVADELSDEYLARLDEDLKRLEFPHGVLISARLGRANKGVGYTTRRPNEDKPGWLQRIGVMLDRSALTFRIPDRDENGFRALSELQAKGVNTIANALAQSADHIVSFFKILRTELAFYLGSVNLAERLRQKGEPMCFPAPEAAGDSALSARHLYDVCLSLNLDEHVVGNELAADRKSLVMITGANQGGKSTFLRSVGLAQLMMQCGMFVPAESFHAAACDGLFTHYTREEDVTMRSGKLDEELSRMSEIADRIRPGSLLLCNESFASTNEREGSEIAREIVRALLEEGVRVGFVTHLYELAHGLHRERSAGALFLRAERLPDGRRTFKLVEGEPLPTSYGKDLYERIFDPVTAPSA